jgi:carbon-monoxide dehydrogenase large subunit
MTTETESTEARTQKLEGLGTRRKRVEDVRFTQGKGNYIDDFKLPGMFSASAPGPTTSRSPM